MSLMHVKLQAPWWKAANVRGFDGVEERFGIRVISPGAFLEELEGGDEW